jgi:hypothetical protein
MQNGAEAFPDSAFARLVLSVALEGKPKPRLSLCAGSRSVCGAGRAAALWKREARSEKTRTGDPAGLQQRKGGYKAGRASQADSRAWRKGKRNGAFCDLGAERARA